MPTPAEILDGLTRIANEAAALAIAWHFALAVVLVLLLASWRPTQRMARVLIALPLASVSMLALAFGNPFNGIVFALAVTALCAIGIRAPSSRASRSSGATFFVGLASIAYGWAYPHFLDGAWTAYLYAAPLGLVPCPTLAVACGLALIGDGLGSRAWTITLAALGLLYGVFGVARLGMLLDVPLIASAGFLLYSAVSRRVGASRGLARDMHPLPS